MSDSLAAISPYQGFTFLFAHSYSFIAEQRQIKLRCRRAQPVLPEEAVILRYLDFFGGEANVYTLGTALGFALSDDFTATPMRYRDAAEAALWSDLLDDLESYGLLKRLNDIVRCTPFSAIAVQHQVKYEYFEADCAYWQFTELESPFDFPFASLGLTTCLGDNTSLEHPGRQAEKADTVTTAYKPAPSTDELAVARLQLKDTGLNKAIEVLELVSASDPAKYPSTRHVPLTGYCYRTAVAPVDQDAPDYRFTASVDGQASPELTSILNLPANAAMRARWGHAAEFAALCATPTAVINAIAIERFAADWKWPDLLADPRLAWTAPGILPALLNRLPPPVRNQLSKLIPLQLLEAELDNYPVLWDWAVLSTRFTDDFITTRLTESGPDGTPLYPWDFEVLSARNPAVVEKWLSQLLRSQWADQLDGSESFQWDWATLAERLSASFILAHLGTLPFSRSILLGRGEAFLESALQAEIATGKLGYWDWRQIINSVSLQFLWDNLATLAAHLPWSQVLERMLGPNTPQPVGFDLSRLLDLVQEYSGDINPLTTQNLAWTPGLIAFFDGLELLHWSSTASSSGFECHPSVAWTAEHFSRYHYRVRTAQGAAYVSARIESIGLVIQYPEFAWNWHELSGNALLVWTRQLTTQFRDQIVWSRLLARFGAAEVAQRLPDLHTQLLESRPDALPDLWKYANRALSVATLLAWRSNYASHLDLTELTHRDPIAVARELLNNPDFDHSWDWSVLASRLPPDLLAELLLEADKYYQQQPNIQLAELSLPAAARLPIDFSLTTAPGMLLPWNWDYVSLQLTPEQLDAHLGELAPKINWNSIVQRRAMHPLLTSAWVIDTRAQAWLPWPQISPLVTPAQVDAHLDALAPFLDWSYVARQPGFVHLVLDRLLDHPVVREHLPWDYVLEKLIAPEDLAGNLLRWRRRLLILADPATRAIANTAFTKRLPVDAVIVDPNATNQPYPTLTDEQLRALPLDWQVLSDDLRLKHRLTVGTLRRYQRFWNWPTLSRNSEFNDDSTYLLDPVLRQRWDWAYISQFSAFIRPYKKLDKVKKHFKRFARFIDWSALSLRQDLPFFGELLQIYAEQSWDWAILSSSPALHLTDSELLGLQEKTWDWTALAANAGLKIQLSTVEAMAAKPWNWAALSANRNVEFDNPTLVRLAEQSWDWSALVKRTDIKWNAQLLRDLDGRELDWTYLSALSSLEWSSDFVREFQNHIDWRILSRNPPFGLTASLLREFALRWDFSTLSRSSALADPPKPNDAKNQPAQPAELILLTTDLPWDWGYLSDRADIAYSTKLLDGLAKHLHWPTLSRRQWGLSFEAGWVQRFRQYWDFPALAVHAALPEAAQKEVRSVIHADHTRVLPYLYSLERHSVRSAWAGYAFHCTHLTNAASIILSGKLLSRDQVLKTKHKLADASGSINYYRSDTWNYARLYYRPRTLTHFYTEELGMDSSWQEDDAQRRHYYQAEGFGFPKCPVPVYFRFRLVEILATQLERFNISDTNIQRKQHRKGPLNEMIGHFESSDLLYHRLDYDGRLGDRFDDFKKVSQQEILLKDWLDIGLLRTVDIFVSSQWAKDELIRLIGPENPLKDRIQLTYDGCFHRENKTVYCNHSSTHIDVSTDFADAHEIVLEYKDLAQADLSEMEPGTYRLTGNRLLTQHKLSVSWPTPVPFRVLFRDKVISRPGGPREYELFRSLE